MMSVGIDHWRCSLPGVILKSDFHGVSGRGQGGGAERTTLTATARRIMEAQARAIFYRVTDSLSGIAFAEDLPACLACLRAFLLRQCR
jgi:hypothetical protein